MQITSGLLPKGGGGSEAIQKFWDTFCVKDFCKGLLGTLFEKVSQKFQKSGGEGGGKTFLEEVHN